MPKIALLFFFISSIIVGQNDSILADNKYLEDQFYANFTYIGLMNTPEQISKTGFSYGIGLGFIKDLPVNERRNIGFGVGAGYGFSTYYFNVKEVTEDFSETNSTELRSNKFSMHTIEFPIELRFRTSTSTKYKFWRIYPGIKFAYAFSSNTSFKQNEDIAVEDIIEIDDFLYGITLSTGFNKWNLHVYYGLNSLFSESKTNSYDINIHEIRMGLIFYIL